MRSQLLGSVFGVLAMIPFVATSAAFEAGGKSDSKVKATATATKIVDGKQTVTITLEIEKGWYIYANPVGDDDYEANRTRLVFKAKEKVTAEPKYPAGEKKKGAKYNIYEGKVVIASQVTRSAGDTSPLQVSINVNTCSHAGECLLPGVVKVTVP